MKVFLYARRATSDYKTPLEVLIKRMHSFGWDFYVNDVLAEFMDIELSYSSSKVLEDYEALASAGLDLVITLGGDGTILGATTLIRDLGLPILGINLGRLGFLAGVELRNLQAALDRLNSGAYHIEKRSMLTLESDPEIFSSLNFALNDFTVHKRDNSSMINIHTYINGEYLNSYWADGLIVATPTGSTGYSMSCGGPIIFPNSGNMVITPVAPHNLNVRPLVISDESVISFALEGRAENFLCTLDSRYETITSKHQLAVRKCEFNTHRVVLNGHSFLQTIHEKLSWGADKRN